MFAKALISAASSSYVEKMDISLPKSKTCLSVPADSVNKHNVSEFQSTKFLAHNAEIRGAVRVVSSHFSYRSNVSIKSFFWPCFRTMPSSKTKDKMSYYVNYEIASAFRDKMLTCVKMLTCPGSSRKFLTKCSRGEKEPGGRTGRSGKK